MDGSAQDIARFFDREACCSGRVARAGSTGLRGASRVVVGLLDEVGLRGRTVLDAGCGQGGLALTLSRRGARTVTGIDLSPASVAAARAAAEAAGVAAEFRVADAATEEIEAHDVVVLHKVVCCYFDPDALLAGSVPAARSVLALSLPHSRGWRGVLARLSIGAENTWRRLRGDPFRAFVHDGDAITGTLYGLGLDPTVERDHGMWRVAVFARRGLRAARPG